MGEANISVGMDVYLRRYGRGNRPDKGPLKGTLAKVGRTYYSVQVNGQPMRFSIRTRLEETGYSPDHKLYFSIESLEEEIEKERLVLKLKNLSYEWFTLETLRAIDSIITGGDTGTQK